MKNHLQHKSVFFWCKVLPVLGLAFFQASLAQSQNICAKVSIEITQELSFERQAFEARMRVENELPQKITDLSARILFYDEQRRPLAVAYLGQANPPAGALFFYRSETSGIDLDPDGRLSLEEVAAGATSRLLWLIIPSPGAAQANPEGQIYYVGATLTYKIGGKSESIEVEPDYIFVKPLPKLKIDYFLPGIVYGDNPQTTYIKEPAEPFSLGIRIENTGYGVARGVTIESGQPKIVANEQGLLADFYIQETVLNNRPARPELTIDFGDLASRARSVGRWIMTSSLSGSFTDFQARYTHADELGGQITSLIDDQNGIGALTLIHDVVVDLSGRDTIMDFLALDGSTMKVYESDAGTEDSTVAFRFENATLETLPNGLSRISTDGTEIPPGQFLYLSAIDPFSGAKSARRVIRSDGKPVNPNNIWFSRRQLVNQGNVTWAYTIHLFDHNARADAQAFSYQIETADFAEGNRPPVILGLVNRYIQTGQQLEVTIRAYDPDGTKPSIDVQRRPVGSSFTDRGDGTALFQWTPTSGQDGLFPVKFTASDGVFNVDATLVISVTDGKLLDEWKKRYFEDIHSAAAANASDPDGDNLSNLLEYGLGTDPHKSSVLQRPRISRETVNGQNYLLMTYERRTDDPALVFETIASDSLKTSDDQWAVLPERAEVSQTDVPDGLVRVQVQDTISLEQAAQQDKSRFLKLRVRYEENR
jgi:hypothetical protein